MNDSSFWLSIWRLVAGVFVTLILTIGGCTANQHRLIAQITRAGADPLKAHCAIAGLTQTSAAMCGTLVDKK